MVVQKVRIGILSGIHFRPAGRLTELAMEFHSKITMKSGHSSADVKSFLSVLAASVKFGEEVEIICDGDDENEAINKIVNFLENGE
ncbi:MAG: HPr family phosphocarrier protein [Lachnospiraceae bacterium]|nr:HPr family phosphocarrier protein [Lachnospiraceae bacterium]